MKFVLTMILTVVVSTGWADATTSTARSAETTATPDRPNIVFIMADDHAAHAVSAYGSVINKTPHIDRIGREGMILENCFATNALCAPSRATILTGKHSHLNGLKTHRDPPFDGSQVTFPKLMQKDGYETAIVGKWHLKSDPTGFDYWNILVGQGRYHNPVMIDNGERKVFRGYATDVVTDKAMEFLDGRDKDKPFMLMVHHKAPHRAWEPGKEHADLYENDDIPEPHTLFDEYKNRATPAANTRMEVKNHLTFTDVKSTPPAHLKGDDLTRWYYQRYIKDYLRCVASVDDNVGRLMDYLERQGLLDNTMVIYTSDQGFFLGDHGWYDKRFMYEESIRMPFLVRYPKTVKAGGRSDAMVTNLDFAPTLLELAGLDVPAEMQGVSFMPVLEGQTPEDWQTDMYYHYYEYPSEHAVAAHYGVRDRRYKLIRYYDPVKEWEFFDLEKDPREMQNRIDDEEYRDEVARLKGRLSELRRHYGVQLPEGE